MPRLCLAKTCVVIVQGSKVPPNEAWLSLDLLMLLSQLYDNGHAPAVHQILEAPQAQYPDVLVLATATALRCAHAIAVPVTAPLNFVLSPTTILRCVPACVLLLPVHSGRWLYRRTVCCPSDLHHACARWFIPSSAQFVCVVSCPLVGSSL